MHNTAEIKVWDPAVRVFHWTLVAAFATAYFTEDDLLGVHTVAGYTVVGLVLFRVLWGFVGSRHARFADFVCKPSRVLTYLKEVMILRPRRYLGHNPAGGAMIVLLLLSLLATTVTGLATYGSFSVEHAGGPLAFWLAGSPRAFRHSLKEVHEFFANFTVILVAVHVAGVAAESWLHRENLVKAMFTGRKPAA